MKRHFSKVLLCVAAMIFAGMTFSCKNDYSDLETKIRLIEDDFAQIKATLADAIVTGVSITGVSTNPEGNTVLTFNKPLNGQASLEIAAGGSDVTVEIKDGVAIITVGTDSYSIPLGAAVNSLQYFPEYKDGIVELGNAGANAFFLASPIPENLNLATFNVLVGEVPERTRASVAAEMIVVNGTATVENGLVKVPLKGIQVEASKTYWAALEMTVGGTTIASNLFRVDVSEDFSFVSEIIDPAIKPIAEMAAEGPAEDGSYTFTMDGAKLLDAINFKDLFEGVPAGATFRAASAAKQPAGDAQNKQSILAGSLKADGAFAWSDRPGTVFGDTGFLIEIVKDFVTIGKAYVKLTDPLAGVNWSGGLTGDGEAEYGARWKGLAVGAQTLDLQATFSSVGNDGEATADWEILHGNSRAGFFEKWPDFLVNAGNQTLIFNNGTRLEVTPEAAKFLVHSAGLYFFNRGFVIRVPNDVGEGGEKWPNFTGLKNGGEEAGGPDWTALDAWGGNGTEYSTTYNMPQGFAYGVTVTKDGVLKTTDAYGGYCLRLAIGARFEYVYGNAKLGFGDQFNMFFFNRRWFPTGAFMPAEFVKE